MDTFTHEDLKVLSEDRTTSCVSLYLRTHPAGPEILQDRIRFRNLLSSAEQQLVGLGLRAPYARTLLEPVRGLEAEDAFWKFQSDGLAVFVTQGFFRTFRLPRPFEDLLTVTGRFHLKPLLPMLGQAGEYYLLALSMNKVRLLRGTRFGLSEAALEGVPQGIDEALTGEQNETYLQYHVRSQSTGGGRAAMFYGQGEGKDDTRDRVNRYFRRVEEALRRHLQPVGPPLVMAGVEYLQPLYRDVNTYPALLPLGINGNAEELKPAELHARAWPLVESLVRKRQQEAEEQFLALRGTGKASTFTPEIVPASFQGRVSKLLVSARKHEWGTVDRGQAGVVREVCKQEERGCEDLYDVAAVQTLLKGGEVYVLESDTVADGAPIAAVYRY